MSQIEGLNRQQIEGRSIMKSPNNPEISKGKLKELFTYYLHKDKDKIVNQADNFPKGKDLENQIVQIFQEIKKQQDKFYNLTKWGFYMQLQKLKCEFLLVVFAFSYLFFQSDNPETKLNLAHPIMEIFQQNGYQNDNWQKNSSIWQSQNQDLSDQTQQVTDQQYIFYPEDENFNINKSISQLFANISDQLIQMIIQTLLRTNHINGAIKFQEYVSNKNKNKINKMTIVQLNIKLGRYKEALDLLLTIKGETQAQKFNINKMRIIILINWEKSDNQPYNFIQSLTEQSMEINQLSSISLNDLGNYFFKKSNFIKAYYYFKQSLYIDKCQYLIKYKTAYTLCKLHYYKEALAYLQKLDRQFIKNKYAYACFLVFKADLLRSLKDYNQALKHYNQSIRYFRQGSKQNQQIHYQQIQKQNYSHKLVQDYACMQAFYGMGLTYYQEKIYQRALDYFSKIKHSTPSFPESYIYISKIYLQQQKYIKFKQIIQQLIKVLNQGTIFLQSDLVFLLKQLKQIKQLSEKCPQILDQLETKQISKFIQIADKSIQLLSNSYIQFGEKLLEKYNYDAALKAFRYAKYYLKTDKNNISLYSQISNHDGHVPRARLNSDLTSWSQSNDSDSSKMALCNIRFCNICLNQNIIYCYQNLELYEQGIQQIQKSESQFALSEPTIKILNNSIKNIFKSQRWINVVKNIKPNKKSLNMLFDLIQHLISRKQIELATQKLIQIQQKLQKGDFEKKYLKQLGKNYYHIGQIEKGLMLLKNGLKYEPHLCEQILFLNIINTHDTINFDDLRDTLQNIKQKYKNQNNQQIQSMLGDICLKEKKYLQSVKYYKKAIESLNKLQNYEKLIACYKQMDKESNNTISQKQQRKKYLKSQLLILKPYQNQNYKDLKVSYQIYKYVYQLDEQSNLQKTSQNNLRMSGKHQIKVKKMISILTKLIGYCQKKQQRKQYLYQLAVLHVEYSQHQDKFNQYLHQFIELDPIDTRSYQLIKTFYSQRNQYLNHRNFKNIKDIQFNKFIQQKFTTVSSASSPINCCLFYHYFQDYDHSIYYFQKTIEFICSLKQKKREAFIKLLSLIKIAQNKRKQKQDIYLIIFQLIIIKQRNSIQKRQHLTKTSFLKILSSQPSQIANQKNNCQDWFRKTFQAINILSHENRIYLTDHINKFMKYIS